MGSTVHGKYGLLLRSVPAACIAEAVTVGAMPLTVTVTL